MRRLVFSLALFVALLASFIGWTVQAAEAQQFYYMGRWEWYQELDAKTLKPTGYDYWQCPGGNCAGLIDLRSIPQMSLPGGAPEGYGFFVYDKPQLSPSLYYLGNSLNYPLTILQKQWIEGNLKLVWGISQTTILDVLFTDLLILNGDPSGQDRWKPLRGSLDTGVKLYLAKDLVRRDEFTQDHIAFQGSVEVFQTDYARLKAKGMSIEQLNKVTGAKMLSLFGRMGDDLLETLLGTDASDGWEKPGTVYIDTFAEEGGNVGLDAHTPSPSDWGSWTEVNGTTDVLSTTDVAESDTIGWNTNRADVALSSDAHYAEIDVVSFDSAQSEYPGVTTRHDAVDNTFYWGRLGNDGTPDIYITKIVEGVETNLATDAGYSPSLPDRVSLTSDGSDFHTLDVDGLTIDVTDTSITGNLRTGFATYREATFDNFEAGDLAVATTVTNAYWY